MNDEIKEILDDLGDKDKYIEEFGYQYKRLSLEDTELLLDYIINLQQEKDDYKSRVEKAIKQAKEKIKGYKETIDMLITTNIESKRYEIAELRYRIREQEDLLNILQNGSDSQ